MEGASRAGRGTALIGALDNQFSHVPAGGSLRLAEPIDVPAGDRLARTPASGGGDLPSLQPNASAGHLGKTVSSGGLTIRYTGFVVGGGTITSAGSSGVTSMY